MALLEKDILKPVVDTYRAHRDATRKDGTSNPDINDHFEGMLKEIVHSVQTAARNESIAGGKAATQGGKNVVHEIVSLTQWKAEIERIMRYNRFYVLFSKD